MHILSHAVLAAREWEMWSQWRWSHLGISSGALALCCVSHDMVSIGKEKPLCYFPGQDPRGKPVLCDAEIKGGVGWNFELGSCICYGISQKVLKNHPQPKGHKTSTHGDLGGSYSTPELPAEMSLLGISHLPTSPHAFPGQPQIPQPCRAN